MFDGGTDVDPAIPVSRPHPSSFRWRRCFKSPDQAFLGLREPLPPRLDRHPPSAARTGDGTTGLLIRPAAVESPSRAVGRERTVSLRHRSDSQIGHHANHQPCEPPCKKKVFLQVSGRLSRPRRGLNGWSSTPTQLVTSICGAMVPAEPACSPRICLAGEQNLLPLDPAWTATPLILGVGIT